MSSYDIACYEVILKANLRSLVIIAFIIFVLLITLLVQSIVSIRTAKGKTWPCIELLTVIALFVLISFSLGTQIVSRQKDISEQAYIQYEGPATIAIESWRSYDGIPTRHDDYIISFNQDGVETELICEKAPPFTGEVENVYLVYSKHAKFIIEIEFLE